MADVAATQVKHPGLVDGFKYTFDATDKTTAVKALVPDMETTIAIQTSGSATVKVELYFENVNSSPTAFVFENAAATASGNDWVKSSLGPVAGVKFTGTVTGGDGAEIIVLQAPRK